MTRHIEDEQLANGVVVRFYDESRRVAGDRWQVKVRYDAVVSVSETFWSLVSGEPELIEEIRAALGGEIVLTNVNERNFISAEEPDNPPVEPVILSLAHKVLGPEDEMMIDILVANDDEVSRIVQDAVEADSEEGRVMVANKKDLIWLKRTRGSKQDEADIEKLENEKNR